MSSIGSREIRGRLEGGCIRLYVGGGEEMKVLADKSFETRRSSKARVFLGPSFISIGYRSAWGENKTQTKIFAVDVPLKRFESLLQGSGTSKAAQVILQWDPYRTLGGKSTKDKFTQKHPDKSIRTLQIGLRESSFVGLVKGEGVTMQDVTPVVVEVGKFAHLGEFEKAIALLPKEEVYDGLNEAVGRKIRLSKFDTAKEGRKDLRVKNTSYPDAGEDEEALVLYKKENRFYMARVLSTSKRHFPRVRFEGYNTATGVPNAEVVPIKSVLSLAQNSRKEGRISEKSAVYALSPTDGKWYYGTIAECKTSGYLVAFPGFGSVLCAEVVKEEDIFELVTLRKASKSKNNSTSDRKLRKVDSSKLTGADGDAKGDGLREGLDKKKEGGANFYLSLEKDTKIADMFSPILSLYTLAVPARYGGGYPMGEILCVLYGKRENIEFQIPDFIASSVASTCFKNPQNSKFGYEFAFIISDVAGVLKTGPNKRGKGGGGGLNLVHHAWVYPKIMPGQRRQKQIWIGAFNLRDKEFSGRLKPAPTNSKGDRDVRVEGLAPHRISVHGDKRNRNVMCCSPNNAKIYLDEKAPVTAFWSVSVDPDEEHPRVLCQLHWIFHGLSRDKGENGLLYGLIQKSSTIKQILAALEDNKGPVGKILGGMAPVKALNFVFRYGHTGPSVT
ncbi:hypothetical protein AAMO2058_001391000 [Amorphochlora amoebiformis]